MKRFSTLCCLLLLAVAGAAQRPTPTPTPTPVLPQKFCTVNLKSPVNPLVKPAVYKGKRYYFCCESCRYQFALKPYKWANR